MRTSECLTRAIACGVLLLLLLVGVGRPAPAQAQESISISGTFTGWPFEIPQGGSVRGLDINVVVFNPTNEQLSVEMSYTAPPDVTIELLPDHFTLSPATAQGMTYKQVAVGVQVSANAAAETDNISVIAQPSMSTGVDGQVVFLPSAVSVASLTVVGEKGNVVVDTVSPRGDPVVTDIRLFKVITNNQYEYEYSTSGHLETTVSPGKFRVIAYIGGLELARDEFDVVPDQEVRKTLTVETVYFKTFQVAPATNTKTGEVGYVQVVYTITNVYQPIANAEVRLVVTFDGQPLHELPILFLGSLDKDDFGVPYQYSSPPGGWERGTYGFKLQLYGGGQLYTWTNEQTVDVGMGTAKSSLWIIFVILGVLGAAGLGFLIFFLLKRRKKGEKPEKAEKKERKKKEEKPARKAEEPVRKPEPFRPPEPVRPVEPVRYEEPTVEPTVEPAPLSSVSSLKARMASLGRDQGTGKVAEEELDIEKKDEPVEAGPLARQPVPVPPPPKIEPERPAVKKVEEKGHKPPASEKAAGHKPGIFSRVTATGKKEPPKAPVAQGPAPVKPGDEIQINWPPKSVEPPKPPSDVQINWPPKPVEPPKPSALEEAARQRVEAQQHVGVPEEAAPEEPGEPESPPSRSSFSEAARLRMEARQHASETGKTGAGPEESQPDGDATGGSGEGGDHSPSP